MKNVSYVVACLCVLGLVEGARAQEAGQHWSIVGPKTLEPSANALEIAAGWPGLSVGYLRGVAPALNLGARVGFVYGIEGEIRSVVPGVKLQVLLKWRILEKDRLSFGLTFEPGPFFHALSGGSTLAGFSIPLGVRLGIAASSALTVAVLVDVPMWVQFGPGGELNVPVLSGVGLEYFVTSTLGLFFRTRLGPTIHTSYRLAEFTFEGSLGVAFKF